MDEFGLIQVYLSDLDIVPIEENIEAGYFVISDPDRYINNMYITLGDSNISIDQYIYNVPDIEIKYKITLFKRLLQMSGELTHGSFILDETGDKVFYHATLALGNLDLNELEAAINSITLGFEEFGRELLLLHGGDELWES